MKRVSQVIPEAQKEILVEALNIMEMALKSLKGEDVNFKLFDILTLKAMLNGTELVVNLNFPSYKNFTAINGVDFPNYSE